MGFPLLIQLRLQLRVLDIFELQLLRVDGHFFVKSVFHVFDLFISVFEQAIILVFLLFVYFSFIIKLPLQRFNLRSALHLQFVYSFLEILELTMRYVG